MYELMLDKLKEMGGKATNKALQEALGWDRADYLNARVALLQARQIVLGKGRGGSVMLVPLDWDEAAKAELSEASELPTVHDPFKGLFGRE